MIETEVLNEQDVLNDVAFWEQIEFEQAKIKNLNAKSNNPETLKLEKI